MTSYDEALKELYFVLKEAPEYQDYDVDEYLLKEVVPWAESLRKVGGDPFAVAFLNGIRNKVMQKEKRYTQMDPKA